MSTKKAVRVVDDSQNLRQKFKNCLLIWILVLKTLCFFFVINYNGEGKVERAIRNRPFPICFDTLFSKISIIFINTPVTFFFLPTQTGAYVWLDQKIVVTIKLGLNCGADIQLSLSSGLNSNRNPTTS